MEINTSPEIDLWELLGNFYKLFKKRKAIILSFFLLGILFGFSNLFTCPLEYKSFYRQEFIAESAITSNEILNDIINNIPSALKNKNTDTTGIAFPDFRLIKGKLDANDNKETRLRVTIEVLNADDIDSALTSLSAYINAIEKLREKFDLQKKQQKQLLFALNKQLTGRDTIEKNTGNSNHLELFEKKQKVEKELALDKIVNFIPLHPEPILLSNTRAAALNVLGYSCLGIVIGFIIAYTLNIIQRTKSE